MTNRLNLLNSKYFHLDLKGAPPKLIFLKALWPILKKWGITGVLLEWEDCFPYSGQLAYLWNQVYTYETARGILQSITDAGLDVIPLVQTFGHMEFVLKHSYCATFREVPIYPSSLCPSHPYSLYLVTALLDQVVQFHGASLKHLHIGADEVWHRGYCDRCKLRLAAGETNDYLFLIFVTHVLNYAKLKWPHLKLIMWDDMMRTMDESLLQASGIHTLVTPMVWHYNSGEAFSLPSSLWTKYRIFGRVWAAGAFKGASGGSKIVTPIMHHVSNTQQWMRCLSDVPIPVKGFVFTGWSRYDHFASLCESLPSGLSCLGVCLRVMGGADDIGNELLREVEQELITSDSDPNGKPTPEDESLLACRHIYQFTIKLDDLREQVQSMLNNDHSLTYMNEWQVANKRVNVMQTVHVASLSKKYSNDFINLEILLRKYLSVLYHQTTIDEWIHTYITILHNRLKKTEEIADNIIFEATSNANAATVQMFF